MSLADAPAGPVIAVSDIDTARAFYEEKLGLPGAGAPGGGRIVSAGGDTVLYLLPIGAEAGSASWPVASFRVDDIVTAVRALRARGVPFLAGEEIPYAQDADRIADQGDLAVAWMHDTDGNILTVFTD